LCFFPPPPQLGDKSCCSTGRKSNLLSAQKLVQNMFYKRRLLESLTAREASTDTPPLHPTKHCCWFHASHESAHSAGMRCPPSLSRLSMCDFHSQHRHPTDSIFFTAVQFYRTVVPFTQKKS